jgi:hypothetical protein
MEHGGSTPLHKVAAHQTHDTAVRADFTADMGHLLPVTQVQRVVFTDNSGDLQKNPTFFRKIIKTGLEKICKIL